ncbi:BON domain-containing protein [Parvularcula dongshanensis]|uniref:BON domain-containing protein n=1 Tax=Parvularcula dongshanensis TaxID=1173995 RepID=A0A840I3K8_9PROT|nr:BON domain-containing protein [Parvularcula dongshanensis]MBB4658768.1 hypothetical protein [Parvularcula dongshanensis]
MADRNYSGDRNEGRRGGGRYGQDEGAYMRGGQDRDRFYDAERSNDDRMRGYYGRTRRSEGGTINDVEDDFEDADFGLGGGPGRGRIGGGMSRTLSRQNRRYGDDERLAERNMGQGGYARDFDDRGRNAGTFGAADRPSHRGKGPKNYVRSDERILEEVNDWLTDDHELDASEITVTVQDREVTLDGVVDSRSQKRLAEDIAHDISGVTHVQNNLRIQDPNVSSGEIE